MSEHTSGVTADRPVAEPDTAEPDAVATERRRRWSVWTVLLGALLGAVATNLSETRPVASIDSSFRVGVTEALIHRMDFGVDVVWPYGPLGFLASPTIINRGLLALAVLYQFAWLTVLFTALIVHLERRGLARRWVAVVLAPFALALSVTANIVPEVVALTIVVVLVVLWQSNDEAMPSPYTWWVLAIAGLASGAQVLVKFGPGALACAVVVVVAVSGGRRLMQAGVAVAAMVVGFFLIWFATGQPISSLGPFFRTSLELSSGYQSGMAFGPTTRAYAAVGGLVVLAAGVLVLGCARWLRVDRRAWWMIVVLVPTAWFIGKQGLVRWDDYHAAGALLMMAMVAAAVRWERRLLVLPVATLAIGALVAIAAEGSRLRSTVADRVDTALVVVSGSRHDEELAAARADLQASYDVPADAIDAVDGQPVHVEEDQVNVAWAYGLDWEPIPIFQSYSAYTAELDEINAARYASEDGPGAVLLNPTAIDGRYDLWESPDARVALTCHFATVAGTEEWHAMRRAPSVCGQARELAVAQVAPGTTIEIPEPTTEDALVVARFELPDDVLGSLATTLGRPLRYARAVVDSTSYRLVPGTATSAHIVRSPGRLGDRVLPHGRIDHDALSFENIGSGDVVVTFEEIPLMAP